MPGTAASYSVKVARNHHGWIGLSGRTELSVRRGLPAGAGISFTSTRALAAGLTPRARTTLTITTAADMPPGTYEVQVRAQRPHRSGTAAVELTVAAPPGSGQPPTEAAPPGAPVVAPDAFTIEGTLPNLLTPGTGEPLDLTLTNLESTDLLIANLSVRVTGASGPQTDLTHACGSEDFSVEQFSGAPDFTLPASSSAQLSELGFDPTEWPTVSMLDRRVNQDGCQGASVALSFTGTATEASS
jgi:hypothetical protein